MPSIALVTIPPICLGMIIYILFQFNARYFYPHGSLHLPNEETRRLELITSGGNRASDFGLTCNSRPYGPAAKPIADKYGANNYLTCIANNSDPKLQITTDNYEVDYETGEIKYIPYNKANKLSTRFYNRKMNPISNPDREDHLEFITNSIAYRKPFSVVGFVPNPKNSNGHCLNESQETDYYNFYDF